MIAGRLCLGTLASLAFVLLALSLACSVKERQEPAPSPPSAGDVAPRALIEAKSGQPTRRSSKSAGTSLPEPPWPSTWRMLERGTVGSENFPLVWYRFDAGSVTPAEAVDAALVAIETLDQQWFLNEASPSSDGETAIGQAFSLNVRMTIKAARSGDHTVVRVHIEPPT